MGPNVNVARKVATCPNVVQTGAQTGAVVVAEAMGAAAVRLVVMGPVPLHHVLIQVVSGPANRIVHHAVMRPARGAHKQRELYLKVVAARTALRNGAQRAGCVSHLQQARKPHGSKSVTPTRPAATLPHSRARHKTGLSKIGSSKIVASGVHARSVTIAQPLPTVRLVINQMWLAGQA
jgi:hypothetical protein